MQVTIAKAYFDSLVERAARAFVFATACVIVAFTLGFGKFAIALIAAISFLRPLLITARIFRERLGVNRPGVLARDRADTLKQREFGKLPFVNPFEAEADLPLEDRITLAAESCVEFNRSLCVLYLRTHAPRRSTKIAERDGSLELACLAAAHIRGCVRPSDHVAVIEPNEIIVCLNLIRDLSNVDTIVARITKRLGETCWPSDLALHIGRAMHPVNGYRGVDLVASARAQASALSEDRPARRRGRKAQG
ncbi:MAG: hypothetical protein KGM42_03700 [Hyphomicrobiales bacterium]|nr:hypothetical protein [Hyphomicrobiales bacterium]